MPTKGEQMRKLLAILILFTSLTTGAKEFAAAHCEVNNFGVKATYLDIEPTHKGLDIVAHYNKLAPQVFVEIKKKIESDLKLSAGDSLFSPIAVMRLHFNSDQCWQLANKAWVVQCISDPSGYPRHTKIEAELTLANGRMLSHEIETRVSIIAVQRINALFGKSERPELSMSLYKPAQPVGSIVLASSNNKSTQGICVNGQ